MGYIGKVPADVLIDPHVDSASIVDSTIVTADIANDAVTSAKLAANSVDSSELIDGSVDNSHLAGSIAINKTLLAGGTGLTLSTNTLNVDAAQTQITSVGTLTGLTTGAITQNAGTFTIKNASSDSNGLKILQDSSDASKIYNHYNGTLELGVSSTTTLAIKSSAVGIGTTSPATATNVLLTVGDTSLGYAGMEIRGGTNAESWRLYSSFDGSNDAIFGLFRVADSSYKLEVHENGNLTVGASNGSAEVRTNRARMRHIDGLADASDYSHGDLYVNHISTGSIYMQRKTLFANNVLIGTTDDDARLMVKNIGGTSYGQFVTIEGDTTDNNNYSGISFKAGTLANAYPEIGVSNGGLMFQMSGGYHSSNYNNRTKIQLNGSDGHINFMTGGDPATEVGRFDALGNFGIGSSGSNLNARIVRGFSANKGLVIETAQPAIQFVDTADTNKYYTQAYDNGTMYFYNDASGDVIFSTNSAQKFVIQADQSTILAVRSYVEGTSSPTQEIKFQGHHAGFGDGLRTFSRFQSLKINSTGGDVKGGFKIQTNSNANSLIDCVAADNNGFVYMPNLGGGSSQPEVLCWSASSGSYDIGLGNMLIKNTSSRKFKKNIKKCELDSSLIYQLEPKTFLWNNKSVHPNLKDFGMIAEDVAEIIPELATRDGDEIIGIRYQMLSVLLLEELKKLKTKVEALENT
jgi:hypothetical protein